MPCGICSSSDWPEAQTSKTPERFATYLPSGGVRGGNEPRGAGLGPMHGINGVKTLRASYT